MELQRLVLRSASPFLHVRPECDYMSLGPGPDSELELELELTLKVT